MKRSVIMVLRGGLRALVFAVLGVIAYFAITKLNIPGPDYSEQQKPLLYGIYGALFFTYMLIEGRRGLAAFSKSEMVKGELDGTER